MANIFYQSWFSSSSWRVRWALAIKGVSYEPVWLDLRAGDQHKPEHRARNPLGYVPTLFMDGHYFSESVAVIEYLDERIPSPPLYPSGGPSGGPSRGPKDAFRRARVRQIVELVNSGIQPMQNLVVLERHSSDAAERQKWAHDFNERGMEALEAWLEVIAREEASHGGKGDVEGEAGDGSGAQFCVGGELTAADLFLVPQVSAARRFGVSVERFVRVLAAEKAALSTEHAMAAHPDNQPRPPA